MSEAPFVVGQPVLENPGWGITVEELPVVETAEYAAEYEATRFRPIEPDSLPTAHYREEEPA